MKKTIILFFTLILFTSCDPGTDCFVYVKNNCSEKITVITITENSGYIPTKITNTSIISNEKKMIYTDMILTTPPKQDFIQNLFSTILVIKGNDTSNTNFMNPSYWNLTSNKLGLNYEADFILEVNPENF